MNLSLLNNNLKQYQTRIAEVVKDLHDLTVSIGHEELSQTVSDLRNRIEEPYMFVIVGEVKSGKSSFVNALLDAKKEITKVAPQPMTDTIQQILYGEEEEILVVNKFLKKIFQPIEILKEIAIVDTPGTNAIIDHHQEITERFIPAADLIVFVFEAKNPYRQSAWQFFDFIQSEWRKKIIFILQQKDLMSAEDLAVNEKGVRDHAEKKGILNPHVFSVSAKQEMDGEHEASGFLAVRDYIKNNITGGKAPVLKIKNNIDLSANINEKIYNGLRLRKQQWDADQNFRADIKSTLKQQSAKSNNQVNMLVENLLAAYDRTTSNAQQELNDGLNFFSLLRRSFSSIFNKKTSAKEWLDELAKRLDTEMNTALNTKLNDSINDVADSIQQMAKMIDLKITNSKTILSNNHDIFADIAERRSNVLRDLQETFAQFLNRTENFTHETLFPNNNDLSPNIVAGSGIAVIGVILNAAATSAVGDITGGVIAGIGILFAGITTTIKRRSILRNFKQETDDGRAKLESEITEKLKSYVELISTQIEGNFEEFDRHLELEESQIVFLEKKHDSIAQRLRGMDEELLKLV